MATIAYTVLLVPDADRGGFTVTVPEIPEIVTEGDTEEDALAMAHEAISMYVGYAAEHGIPIPIERAAPRLRMIEVEAGLPAVVARGAR